MPEKNLPLGRLESITVEVRAHPHRPGTIKVLSNATYCLPETGLCMEMSSTTYGNCRGLWGCGEAAVRPGCRGVRAAGRPSRVPARHFSPTLFFPPLHTFNVLITITTLNTAFCVCCQSAVSALASCSAGRPDPPCSRLSGKGAVPEAVARGASFKHEQKSCSGSTWIRRFQSKNQDDVLANVEEGDLAHLFAEPHLQEDVSLGEQPAVQSPTEQPTYKDVDMRMAFTPDNVLERLLGPKPKKQAATLPGQPSGMACQMAKRQPSQRYRLRRHTTSCVSPSRIINFKAGAASYVEVGCSFSAALSL